MVRNVVVTLAALGILHHGKESKVAGFAAPPRRLKDHSRRQLLANAAIAASHVAEKTRVGCGICADS